MRNAAHNERATRCQSTSARMTAMPSLATAATLAALLTPLKVQPPDSMVPAISDVQTPVGCPDHSSTAGEPRLRAGPVSEPRGIVRDNASQRRHGLGFEINGHDA